MQWCMTDPEHTPKLIIEHLSVVKQINLQYIYSATSPISVHENDQHAHGLKPLTINFQNWNTMFHGSLESYTKL